jgi:hypothetical protein
LLSENIPLTASGEIKSTCASNLADLVSPVWKKIAGKMVEQSLNKCCIKTHLMTQKMVSYGIPDLDRRNLKIFLKEL